MRHDWHHRKPRSKKGKGNRQNLSKVPMHLHQAWHALFVNYDADKIAEIINETWLDYDYIFVVERREK